MSQSFAVWVICKVAAEERTWHWCRACVQRELRGILTNKGPPLELKGKMYTACSSSVIVYGSDTWVMSTEQMAKLERSVRCNDPMGVWCLSY